MKLIMLNDDIHSFEEVIYLLGSYLTYPKSQLISIVSLVDNVGWCSVMESENTASISDAMSYLTKQGLSLKIEDSDV